MYKLKVGDKVDWIYKYLHSINSEYLIKNITKANGMLLYNITDGINDFVATSSEITLSKKEKRRRKIKEIFNI
jgi:hypothetical protein